MSSAKPAILDRDQCGIRIGEISILMATRGRAEMLAEEIESLKQNTVNKAKVKLWIYVDDDDQVMLDAIAAKKFPDPGFPIHWHVGPRPGALGLCHQALWNASGRVSEIYTISVDDVRFDTHGWDEVVRGAFTDCRDGVLLAFAHDPNAPQATFPYIGWGFLLTLGYEKIFPGIFIYWFDDKWIEQIAVMAGRCVKVPVTMNPIGDKGLTQRMRNVPFWTRFCQLTVIERKDSSQKLIDAMHAKDSGARYEIHAALLAGGIVSDVKAGENHGRKLQHDFVVVDLLQIGMTSGNGVAHGRFVINAPKSPAGKTRALVAWVTLVDAIQPIQATGGWLLAPGQN